MLKGGTGDDQFAEELEMIFFMEEPETMNYTEETEMMS